MFWGLDKRHIVDLVYQAQPLYGYAKPLLALSWLLIGCPRPVSAANLELQLVAFYGRPLSGLVVGIISHFKTVSAKQHGQVLLCVVVLINLFLVIILTELHIFI